MKVNRTRRAARVVAALCVALLVSSCSDDNPPGVAADVNGQTITDDQVDEFAMVLCELGGVAGETDAGTPTRNARARSLELLINNQLALDVGADVEVDQAAINQAVADNRAARDVLPEPLQETFDAFVDEFAEAQMTILALGRESLESSGQAGDGEIADNDAYAEGQRLRLAYADDADISIDPRFGTLKDGVVIPTSGSLSVPQSEEAKAALQAQPSMAVVAAMPGPLKCGAGTG